MSAPITVAILGGDPIVGQALELLLPAVGYGGRFLPEPVTEKLGELLEDVGLLLLAPALSNGSREALRNGLKSEPSTAKIPVLELLTASRAGARTELGGYALWPCRVEELKKEIDAALGTRLH